MPSLLRRVKSKMFIFAHRRTLTMLDGEYGSVFKGRSLDFDELRSYVPGDEVRDIDWKATARHGSPLVKRYVAVRRHSVLLLVDTGRNMAAHAASGESKKDIAVDAAGVLGYLACRHGDDVGLLHGSAATSRYLPPQCGEEHLERLLREVDAGISLDGQASAITEQLDYALRFLKGRLLIAVLADEFMPDARTEMLLRRLRARHEVLWLTILDARMAAEPGQPASTQEASIDVGNGLRIPAAVARNSVVRAAYASAMRKRREERSVFFRRLGIAEQPVGATVDVLPAVFALLEKHRSGAKSPKGSNRAG
ncbi:uncharacterized protein (DUF58 family) [Arthrobacter sp. 1088]|uniref:DUF58 domain-containing protein n=1 Tax=Arthrobacter sp. 1088 TaxID=2817768 RepID=UPI00285CC347|nr:DUF58 domain-containing protein [Arthrobacter sp. 1088]MDR6687604.1 uncharacterized protein (DUF58 family) [Arthrobacter sp. 1088]